MKNNCVTTNGIDQKQFTTTTPTRATWRTTYFKTTYMKNNSHWDQPTWLTRHLKNDLHEEQIHEHPTPWTANTWRPAVCRRREYTKTLLSTPIRSRTTGITHTRRTTYDTQTPEQHTLFRTMIRRPPLRPPTERPTPQCTTTKWIRTTQRIHTRRTTQMTNYSDEERTQNDHINDS